MRIVQSIEKSKKINLGMIYAGASFFVSIVIGFYTYRFLWVNSNKDAFVAWLAIFEISQFLLLLDLGFTHNFIKNHIHSDDDLIKRALPELRGILISVGMAAAGILLLISVALNHLTYDLILPYALLSLSVLFTIASYAETVVLKIKHKFNAIYTISILSNFAYAVMLTSGVSENVINTLSIATVIRSIIQFAAQNRVLAIDFTVKFGKKMQGSMNVIGLNASYFTLFMFDTVILMKSGLPAVTIALIIILRKYFDTLRGFWDSVLSVASIGFAKSENRRRDLLLCGAVAVSYILAYFAANSLITLWLRSGPIDAWLSFCVGFSGLALSIYRIESTRLYFQSKLNFFGLLVISLLIKLAYLASIDKIVTDASGAYALQAVELLGVVFFMVLLNGKRSRHN